jgi:hypothetical protein
MKAKLAPSADNELRALATISKCRGFEATGVEFTNGDQPGVRLRKAYVNICEGANDMKSVVITGGILIGLFLIGLAALYFLTPADHLPAFVPGYDPESNKRHLTHALGALAIGLIAFAMAWLRGWGD